MKKNHIYLGDCIQVMKSEIPDKAIDLIVADVPYNLSDKDLTMVGFKDWNKVNEDWDKIEDYPKFTEDWITQAHRVLKDNGSIYVCCSYHNLDIVLGEVKKRFYKVNNLITAYKSNSVPSKTQRTFTHSTEFIIYAVKGPNWVFNYNELKKANPEKQKNGDLKQMRDMWTIPICHGKERVKDDNGKTLHKTQKPLELVRRTLLASSNPSDLVLDPFLGVGTTAVACRDLGRDFIGIELDESYVDASYKRLKLNNPHKEFKNV